MTEESSFGLLFDCDGVIVETEELHRIAYNKAFDYYKLVLKDKSPVTWNTTYYNKLQNTVGGGKPKMRYYFNEDAKEWPITLKPYKTPPRTEAEQAALVDKLQDKKTKFYKLILEEIAQARPGVLELMDAAIANPNIKVGICSAAMKEGFVKLVNTIVGEERLKKLDIVLAGDDVKEKKPHPMIYNTARERISLPAERCVVIEDSLVGLRAARAANMNCIITYTSSTAREDFYAEGAAVSLSELAGVTLEDIFPITTTDQHSSLEEKLLTLKHKVTTPLIPTSDEEEPEHNQEEEVKEEEIPVVEEMKEEEEEVYLGWTPHDLLIGRNIVFHTFFGAWLDQMFAVDVDEKRVVFRGQLSEVMMGSRETAFSRQLEARMTSLGL